MPDMPPVEMRLDHWVIVRDILRKHVPQFAVWAFGSRARQTAKRYSDLDLAIICDTPLPLKLLVARVLTCDDGPWAALAGQHQGPLI